LLQSALPPPVAATLSIPGTGAVPNAGERVLAASVSSNQILLYGSDAGVQSALAVIVRRQLVAGTVGRLND
jgi:hypothetical protein